MTTYTSLSGIKQLLDTTQWDEEVLNEEAITLSASARAWINMQISRDTDFTEAELSAEPIIVMAANAYAVYTLLSTQLDSHRVEDHSLALRRLEDAKDLIRAYCLRNGVTPVFDQLAEVVSGCVGYAFQTGTDGNCI